MKFKFLDTVHHGVPRLSAFMTAAARARGHTDAAVACARARATRANDCVSGSVLGPDGDQHLSSSLAGDGAEEKGQQGVEEGSATAAGDDR